MSKKVVGIVLGSMALLILIVILILSFALPAGFWLGAKDAKEYDDWATSASSGDSITISGKIAEEQQESLLGVSIYSYRMEGCEEQFLSSEDLGNEGDGITVEIEYRELGPEARAKTNTIVVYGPNLCCGIMMLILLIVGLILFLLGFKKKD